MPLGGELAAVWLQGSVVSGLSAEGEVALVGGRSVWFHCDSSIPRIKFRAFLGESDGTSRIWKIADTHRQLDLRLLKELFP